MAQNDTSHPLWRDLMAGFGLLTRLPAPVALAGGSAAWTWPLVGLAVALLSGGAGLFGLALGLPPGIAAGAVLLVQGLVTGALHEDGLADSADGLWGGHDKARRLEIMKDSRIGTYGVLALMLVLGMRWQAVAMLLPGGLIQGGLWKLVAAAVLSRAAMAGVMAALPPARNDGVAHAVGQPEPFMAAVAGVLALLLAGVAVGWAAIPAALAVLISATTVAMLAKARIGGQSGDILGATQQVSELAVLLVLVSLI